MTRPAEAGVVPVFFGGTAGTAEAASALADSSGLGLALLLVASAPADPASGVFGAVTGAGVGAPFWLPLSSEVTVGACAVCAGEADRIFQKITPLTITSPATAESSKPARLF